MRLKDVEFDSPVLFQDGRFGIVIRIDEERGVVGVQVPGDEEITWMDLGNLSHAGGGALSEDEDYSAQQQPTDGEQG